MNFKNEYELQEFIHSVIGGTREVTFQNGKRIDILSEHYAVEVKPKLTRSAIYQAMGQLTAYKSYTGDRQLVVAGISPSDAKSAESTANEARAAGMEVWFVDQMPAFQSAWNGVSSESGSPEPSNDIEIFFNWLFGTKLGWASIIFAAVCWLNATSQPQGQPPPTVPLRKQASEVSLIVEKVPQDATVTILQCNPAKDWVQVRWGSKQGWVGVGEFDNDVCE